MIKHKEQRVGVLVDVSNMYHSAKNLYKRNVNFSEVLKNAVASRKLIRAIAYAIKTKGGEEDAFLGALGKQGFEVKVKDLQIFFSGAKKADWDVGISVDAIKLAENTETPAEIHIVKEMLQHSDVNTTLHYFKMGAKKKRELISRTFEGGSA